MALPLAGDVTGPVLNEPAYLACTQEEPAVLLQLQGGIVLSTETAWLQSSTQKIMAPYTIVVIMNVLQIFPTENKDLPKFRDILRTGASVRLPMAVLLYRITSVWWQR